MLYKLLNDKQKQFLFDKRYVDAKVLDSLTYEGWQKYWINNHIWKLQLDLNRWNMRTLTIQSKDNIGGEITFDLNFQGNDFKELMKIEGQSLFFYALELLYRTTVLYASILIWQILLQATLLIRAVPESF